MTQHKYEKSIVYDPQTLDFAMYLDKELVGFARTYGDAENTLDQFIAELLSGQQYVAQQAEAQS